MRAVMRIVLLSHLLSHTSAFIFEITRQLQPWDRMLLIFLLSLLSISAKSGQLVWVALSPQAIKCSQETREAGPLTGWLCPRWTVLLVLSFCFDTFTSMRLWVKAGLGKFCEASSFRFCLTQFKPKHPTASLQSNCHKQIGRAHV